jgi:hypothetical protein
MRVRRRRLALALLVVVPVLVIAADYALWRWAVWRLEFGIGQWMAQSRAAGWSVSAGTPQPGGWPFAASVTLPHPFLSGGAAELPGGLAWSADRVVVSLHLLHPRVLQIEPAGQQHLQFAGGFDLPFTADRLIATLPLAAGPPTLDATARALRVGGARGRMVAVQSLALHGVQSTAALGFALRSSGISLPGAQSWALGPEIASAAVTGTISGGVTQASADAPPDLAARAASWRDHGGRVNVQSLALSWGPLAVAGTARLRLDRELQPAGSADARLTGYAPALDRLAAQGVITAPTAAAAKAVLSLIAQPAPGTGEAEVTVPLTLAGRELSIGAIPLLRLPLLVWPTAGP